MLKIARIKNGIVIDHIKAGYGIKIFNKLELENTNLNVALIMNVESESMGKKDIIKMELREKIDYSMIAMISPNITINEIENENIINKFNPKLKSKVIDEIICENENCITINEKYVPQSFILVDENKGTYRCEYCDHIQSI
ncbi:aspartate carbamoyltransferase regulatory subunit [uncultured Clostridium sp.]|uniref:aspartate carbamoyltransferase regulatory subunit n=1 Tax=uncultured Clostridium sp. TaxID=59620 RepID=UPI002612594E|nr:aspartate carbamoyltransferase regulatory subunit [uncultured Clostridium sp.]